MKSLIALTLILPLISAIDIHFTSLYGNGIKKIEVPNCREEPCGLIKGQPLEVKITYETTYPKEQSFDDVIDAIARVYLDGYRNRYIFDLVSTSFCKTQSNECPLVLHKEYTFITKIFLEEDTAGQSGGFGQRNGKTQVYFEVVLQGTKGGSNNAEMVAIFDIQAPH